MARTAPSGTRGDACGVEPRTRGAVAPAECQSKVSEVTPELRMILLVLAVRPLAAIRNPVEPRCPLVLDQGYNEVGIRSRIAQHANRVLEL
jgi:hypothetical protein